MKNKKKFLGLSEEEMKFLGKCPVCFSQFESGLIRLLEKKDEASSFHVTCVSCSTALLVVMISGRGSFATTVGVMTDLSARDAAKLAKVPVLTTDDVLEVYASWKDVWKNTS